MWRKERDWVTCERMDITLTPGMIMKSYVCFFLWIFCIISSFDKDVSLNKILLTSPLGSSNLYQTRYTYIYIFSQVDYVSTLYWASWKDVTSDSRKERRYSYWKLLSNKKKSSVKHSTSLVVLFWGAGAKITFHKTNPIKTEYYQAPNIGRNIWHDLNIRKAGVPCCFHKHQSSWHIRGKKIIQSNPHTSVVKNPVIPVHLAAHVSAKYFLSSGILLTFYVKFSHL